MKPRDLTLSVSDTLDLDADLTLLPGGLSPLSLLSPNTTSSAVPRSLALSPAQTTKPAASAAAFAAALPPLPDDDEEENEPVAPLPQLGGMRRGARGRPDPRRQSLAISQLFAGLSEGAGLLGDSELAVGDEDIQVPLAKSGRLLGGAANHSSLFCDPDTGDLLETELPSPQIAGGAGNRADRVPTPLRVTHSGSSDVTEVPSPLGRSISISEGAEAVLCDSPVLAPVLRGTASARRTPAARASMAVFGDLTKACEGQGLDDFDGSDFQLQDSNNKVRELVFLFKMDGAATPRSSVEAPKADAADLRASGDGGTDAVRQRLQKHQVQPGSAATAEQETEQQQHARPAGRAATAGTPAAAKRHPPRPPAPSPMPAAQPAATAQTCGRSAAATTGGKAAASKLPAPPARASRLRPPTTSSGFFSNTATGNRPPGRAEAAGTVAAGRPTSAGTASKGRLDGRPGGSSTAAAAAGTTHSPAAPRAAAAKPTASRSRLGQVSSRIPTPNKPHGGGDRGESQGQGAPAFNQRTVSAAAARQRPAGTAQAHAGRAVPAAAGGGHGTPASSARIPALRMASASPAAAASPADMTPNTARLRWLEQNPDLAFGGGTKLAASPACQLQQQPRKLTAAERHLQEWQDHL